MSVGFRGYRVTLMLGVALSLSWRAAAETRVQDVARLQGQRTNKLVGFGLVVGLPGTGDGGKNERVKRALMAMHKNFHQPVMDIAELDGVSNVTIVSVEASIPEYGAREGETVDVVVSAIGQVKSLAGGQLLTTPLQYAALDPTDPSTQEILALAGGRIDLPEPSAPTRGLIRNGATLEADFLYSFIEDDHIWLVLDNARAGWPWANAIARMINYELASDDDGGASNGRVVVDQAPAVAIGPKNVRVMIPARERSRPAAFIQRVLQTPIFDAPDLPARVVINRTSQTINVTGTVTVAPTVLQIPGVGAVSVGVSGKPADPAKPDAGAAAVEFQELLQTLNQLKVDPGRIIAAIEDLHRTGTLNAQLVYTE